MPMPNPQNDDLSFLSPPVLAGDIGSLGGYRILALIGKGAMGFVFKGLDVGLQRVIALKVMRPNIAATSNSRDRMLREARAAAALQCENVVTIYQVGEDRGIPFIAMEFLEGLTLEAWQNRQSKVVPLGAICRVARDLLRGLAAAHEKGLVHRDIKPANLWVDQKSGRVKILDFGLTKDTESEENLTIDGSILGTPGYMSPEQASGKHADCRSDLFSAGTVLYHLVTGSSPFQRQGLLPTLSAVINHDPVAIQSIRPEVPGELSDFIAQLISKSPEERPENGQMALLRWAEVEKSIRKVLDTRPRDSHLKAPQTEGLSETASRANRTDILEAPESSITQKKSSSQNAPAKTRKLVFLKGTPLALLLAGTISLIGIIGWIAFSKTNQTEIAETDLTRKQPGKETQTAPLPSEKKSENQSPKPKEMSPVEPDKKTIPSGIKEGQERFTNRFGIQMVIVKPGKFRLGGTGGTRLIREETVKNEFFVGVHEVTQGQWEKVTGENPSHFSKKGEGANTVKDIPDEDLAHFPVEMVSWNDAKAFVDRLNLLDPHPDWEYRLPTLIEWEYACRGGHLMNEGDDLMDYYGFKPSLTLAKNSANLIDTTGRPKKVGSYVPNALGLYDMHGNVAEWCADLYVPKNKTEIPSERIIKGGSWASPPEHSRAGASFTTAQNASTWALGFRVILARKTL